MKLSDAAKAEIAAAVKILREDGFHIARGREEYLKSSRSEAEADSQKGKPPEDAPPGPDGPAEPKDGDPPPPNPEPNEPPKRKSLWWGDRE